MKITNTGFPLAGHLCDIIKNIVASLDKNQKYSTIY